MGFELSLPLAAIYKDKCLCNTSPVYSHIQVSSVDQSIDKWRCRPFGVCLNCVEM